MFTQCRNQFPKPSVFLALGHIPSAWWPNEIRRMKEAIYRVSGCQSISIYTAKSIYEKYSFQSYVSEPLTRIIYD